MNYVILAVMLTLVNYGYQAISGGRDYVAAKERSFFQLVAVLCCWLVTK